MDGLKQVNPTDDLIQATIKQKFLEELHDVEKYLDLCEKSSDSWSKQIFRDIAKDEMSHAKFLKEIIHNHNFTITEAEHEKAQELYNRVKEKLNSI